MSKSTTTHKVGAALLLKSDRTTDDGCASVLGINRTRRMTKSHAMACPTTVQPKKSLTSLNDVMSLGIKRLGSDDTGDDLPASSCTQSENGVKRNDHTNYSNNNNITNMERRANIEKVRSGQVKLIRELVSANGSKTPSRMKLFLQKEGRFANPKKRALFDSDGHMIDVTKRDMWQKNEANSACHRARLTFFNGGTCHFPAKEWSAVLRQRAADVENLVVMYDNHMAYDDEGFRMFFELDYRSDYNNPSYDEILQHASLCQDVVKSFFVNNPSANCRMWFMPCDPKLKFAKDNIEPVLAMGVHLIFPDIIVNTQMARQMAAGANLRLEAVFYGRNKGELVDMDCYRDHTVSLRPSYAHKIDNCLTCMNDDDMRLTCETCYGRGRVPTGSTYRPMDCFLHDGSSKFGDGLDGTVQQYVSDNIHLIMIETSIVCETPGMFTDGYSVPAGEPELSNVRQLKRKVSGGDKSKMKFSNRVHQGAGASCDRRTGINMTNSVGVMKILYTIIKQYGNSYNDPRMVISKVTLTKRNMLFINIKGAGAHFCRIRNALGHEHSSNSIYFLINVQRGFIAQYCYDGDCKEVTKGNYPLRLKQKLSAIIMMNLRHALALASGDKVSNK